MKIRNMKVVGRGPITG